MTSQKTSDKKDKSVTPGASKKPAMKSPRVEKTRKAKEQNEFEAGRPDNLSSFISTYKTEPCCAKYLGYDEIGQFRKLQLSFHVLEYYNVWALHCGGVKSSHAAMELIRDFSDREPEDRFPAKIETTMKLYGPLADLKNPEADEKLKDQERETNMNYLMATLIYRLTEHLQTSMDVSPRQQIQRQANASEEFTKQHPSLKVPDFDTEAIIPPKLGPHIDLDEHMLEKYNRTHNLIRSVAWLTSQSRWKDKIGKNDPFPIRQVHPSYTPRWMIANSNASVQKTKVDTFPAKKISLVYDRKRKTKWTEELIAHVRDYVEAQGLAMPPLEVRCLRDPRAFDSGEQWRDTVRRQLSMESLRVEFFTLAFVELPKSEGAEGIKMPFYASSSQNLYSWRQVKDALLQSDLEVQFVYTLKPLDEDEDFQYEYSGAPLALQEDFHLGADGDIEQIHGATSALVQDGDEDEKLVNEAEEAEAQAFLSGGGITIKKPPIPQSEFSVADREKMLEEHNGHDVFTPDGLRAWQEMVIDTVAMGRGPQPKATKEIPFKGNKRISKSQREALRQGQEAGEAQALTTDTTEIARDGRYYQIQAAFTGGQDLVGPFVDPSKIALGMKTVGKHKDIGGLDLSECTALPRCRAKFLDSQITGAAFMLQRTYGAIPVDKKRMEDPAVAKAIKELESVKTSGGFLCDVTGLGKTDETLLALSWSALYGENPEGHKPHLIVVPNGAVFSQWQEKIWNDYRDLQLIISNDERPSEGKFHDCWVSSSAMREAPASLKNWPEKLRYIFDTKDRRASKAVILTTYDSHMARTVGTRWVDKTDLDRKEALALPSPHSKTRKKSRQERQEREKELLHQEPIFTSKWKGIFQSAWLDEGHRIRHAITKTHASILLLECRVYWIITATSVINSSFDVLGGLHLLWPQAQRELMKHQDKLRWMMEQPEKSYEVFVRLRDLPPTDVRRLIALDPNRIRELLETRNVVKIKEYYHFLDNLITIRRSTASVLYQSKKGEPIHLKSIMPKHEVRTVELEYDDEEALEAQWFHRNNARLYMAELSRSLEGNDTIMKQRHGPDTSKKRQSKFAPTTAHARRLTIGAKATKLSRFDFIMQKLGRKTLVDDMQGYRTKGHTAEWVVNMVLRKGDNVPRTRLERLQFLAEGSPTLRYILQQIKEMGLLNPATDKNAPKKLLITEDVPLVAWYWEICLNYLYVHTETLHSSLNYTQRIDLVRRFNDPKSSLRVVNMMYTVGAQGTNMDKVCCRVLVTTAASNASSEIQAWGRVIRVSQISEVLVIRLKVKNTHDQWRDSRQTDKALMDLAGKANDPAIQQLLVQLLNEKNYEVMEAHESEQGILMKAQATGQAMTDVATPFITEIEDGQKLAVTVPEDMDIDRPSDQSEGGSSAMKYPLRREPKQVQRMINQPEIQKRLHGSRKLSSEDLESSEEDYGDSGSEYSTDSENRYDSGVDSSSATDSDDPEKEGREVVAASNEYITDPNGDIRLLSRTTAEIRRTYSRLTKTEQEDFDQDTIALKQLLTMDPKKVYSIKDLETPDVLDRALRLLFRARFGQAQEYVRISPHIKYDKLSKETLKAIERNTKIQDEEVKRLRFLAAAAGNTTGAELPSDIVGNQEGGAGVGGGGSKGKVVKRSKGTGKAGGKKKRRRAD